MQFSTKTLNVLTLALLSTNSEGASLRGRRFLQGNIVTPFTGGGISGPVVVTITNTATGSTTITGGTRAPAANTVLNAMGSESEDSSEDSVAGGAMASSGSNIVTPFLSGSLGTPSVIQTNRATGITAVISSTPAPALTTPTMNVMDSEDD